MKARLKGSHAILMPQLYRRYIEAEVGKASISFQNPIEHLAISQQTNRSQLTIHSRPDQRFPTILRLYKAMSQNNGWLRCA
jgi:hypothetical protein